jgi:hypothetical protein
MAISSMHSASAYWSKWPRPSEPGLGRTTTPDVRGARITGSCGRPRGARGTERPVEIRVRDLLARWNASGRTQAASERLAADLENYGLITSPNFLKTGLDSLVQVVERPLEVEGSSTDADGHERGEPSSTFDEVGLTLGNTPSANLGVEAVTPQATYDEAITRMLLNDFSQLAVMVVRAQCQERSVGSPSRGRDTPIPRAASPRQLFPQPCCRLTQT